MTIKAKAIQAPITNQTFKERFGRMLIALIAVLLLIYVYGIVSTIHLVLERRGYEKETRSMLSELSGTEAEYLRIIGSLTMEKAHELGLYESLNPQFVSLSASKNLSFNVTGYEH